MKKKFMCLILAFIMVLSLVPGAAAASDEATQAAQTLYELGLFRGTGTNADGTPIFDLDKTPTRNQAVIMLVRLLGKEEEALAGTWDLPFTDVAKGSTVYPYIGYAYANGLTNGTTATTYSGTNPIRANQYIAFVLRALGYVSGEDFVVSSAWELSDALGITHREYNAANAASFMRANVVGISASALAAEQKGSTKTLAEKLIQENVFTQAQYSAVTERAGETETPVKIDSALLNAKTQFGVYSLHEYLLSLQPTEVIFGAEAGKPLDKYFYEGVLIGDKIGKEIMKVYTFPSVEKSERWGKPLIMNADHPVGTSVSCNVHPDNTAVVDIFHYTGDGLTYAVTYCIRYFTRGQECPPASASELLASPTAFGDKALHRYLLSMQPDAVCLNRSYPDCDIDNYYFFDDSVAATIVDGLYGMYNFEEVNIPPAKGLDGADNILRSFVVVSCRREGGVLRYIRMTVVDENGFGRTTDYVVEFIRPDEME